MISISSPPPDQNRPRSRVLLGILVAYGFRVTPSGADVFESTCPQSRLVAELSEGRKFRGFQDWP